MALDSMIDEDLPQPLLVGPDEGAAAGLRSSYLEPQPLGRRLHPEHVDDMVEKSG